MLTELLEKCVILLPALSYASLATAAAVPYLLEGFNNFSIVHLRDTLYLAGAVIAVVLAVSRICELSARSVLIAERACARGPVLHCLEDRRLSDAVFGVRVGGDHLS